MLDGGGKHPAPPGALALPGALASPAAPSRRAQYRPFTARLSASVPPLVKITSLGRAPNAPAISSRDSSTTRRARRPALCSEDGLPSLASSSDITSSTSGSRGVVAA